MKAPAKVVWPRRRNSYADLAFIQEQLGIELTQPQQMTMDDIHAVGTAAEVLRTGEGTATFGQAERLVQKPSEIPRQPDELREQGSVRRMVSYPIFGHEVKLGLADYELPPVKVVNVVPYGTTPDAPARVVLEAEGDGHALPPSALATRGGVGPATCECSGYRVVIVD